MDLADFDYDLPPALIAQEPAARRDASRLLRLGRKDGAIEHRRFADLRTLLPDDCVLVLNDTRVIPARLRGRKPTGGKVELLLVRRVSDAAQTWRVLCKGAGSQQVGDRVSLAGDLWAEWVAAPTDGEGVVRFFSDPESDADFARLLERYGEAPLPPYIKRRPGPDAADRERYQTVYAREPGAVAAPTAGLHFTPELLAALERDGITLCCVTLHVGPGTFQPVRTDRVEAHRMAAEAYDIGSATAETVNAAKARGRKVIAVGTTTTRALEASARHDGRVHPGADETDLFIYPGYRFRVVDGLLTNFHLPRSTLLLLVSALAGRESVLRAYAEAVHHGYRFYSYGDAMLIV